MKSKKLYYWTISILLVAVFVLSIVGVSFASKAHSLDKGNIDTHIKALNSINQNNKDNPQQRKSAVVDYIRDVLEKEDIAQPIIKKQTKNATMKE